MRHLQKKKLWTGSASLPNLLNIILSRSRFSASFPFSNNRQMCFIFMWHSSNSKSLRIRRTGSYTITPTGYYTSQAETNISTRCLLHIDREPITIIHVSAYSSIQRMCYAHFTPPILATSCFFFALRYTVDPPRGVPSINHR